MAVKGPPPAKFQTSELDITTEKVMKMDMIDRYVSMYIYIHMQQSRKQNKMCEDFDDVM